MIVTVSSEGHVSKPLQTMDEILDTDYKWFSLHNNILDGSFHPIGSISQQGWWGGDLSDVNGYFSIPQVLTYEDVRAVHYLRVAGDDHLAEYPRDFTIKLYDGLTVLYTETITDNTDRIWEKIMSVVYDITKLEVTITRINKSSSVVKIVEALNPFLLLRDEVLDITLGETSLPSLQLRVDAVDTLHIEDSTSVAITNYFDTSDILSPYLSDPSTPRNVYTICDQPARQIFAQVEILYTDPSIDPNITLSANGTAYNTSLAQTTDGISEAGYKFFALGDNVLDGTYHPLGISTEVGWWSNVVSNALGEFTVDPQYIMESPARSMNMMRMTGDDKTGVYAVDFTFDLYDIGDNLLYSQTVVGNTELSWFTTIEAVINVTKTVFTIHKINKPNCTARILESYPIVQETYYNDRIMSIDILEELGYQTGSLPLGNVSANEVDILLSNFDRHFDTKNELSPLTRYLKKNRRVKVWFGVEVLVNEIEWYPMGVYWTTAWDIPVGAATISLTARDLLELMRTTEFQNSQLYENKNLYELFEIVLQDYGLDPINGDYVLDAGLLDIVVPYAWFSNISHRDALQRIAGCANISLYVDHEGVLRVLLTPNGTETEMWALDETKNIYSTKTPMAWAELTNFVEVVSQSKVLDPLQVVMQNDDIATIDPGVEVTLTYEYDNVPCSNLQVPSFTKDVDIEIVSYATYSWGMQVVAKNNGITTQQITGVSIEGQVLADKNKTLGVAKDTQSILEDGKLKVQVVHDFIQTGTYAQQLANSLLASYSVSRYDIDIDGRGCIALRLNDKVRFVETSSTAEGNFLVQRQSVRYNGAFEASIQTKRIKE